MLARQMTADLQHIRESIQPGETKALVSKGVYFGVLARRVDGSWDTSHVQGLPAPSLIANDGPPSLLILPFSQAGASVSLRDFTNNAFNQHLGMQSEERFGNGIDEDGDGVVNELTRADITAVTLYQATLPIPGQVIPSDSQIRQAIRQGAWQFRRIGCANCHVPALPLVRRGWIYTEPNPYNPGGDLQDGEAPSISVDLTSGALPGPRLKPAADGIVWVPAFTDLKLHDITNGPDDPNAEPQGQARSGDAVSEPAIGSAIKNRIGNAAFPGGSAGYWQPIIEAPNQFVGYTSGQVVTNSSYNFINEYELPVAVSLFNGTQGNSVGGSTCFFSPSLTDWTNIDAALQSETTTYPSIPSGNDPGCFSKSSPSTQIVYKSSIGANTNKAPAFVFERQRSSSSDPAVVEIL